jgi:hypothetical protein
MRLIVGFGFERSCQKEKAGARLLAWLFSSLLKLGANNKKRAARTDFELATLENENERADFELGITTRLWRRSCQEDKARDCWLFAWRFYKGRQAFIIIIDAPIIIKE